MNINHSGPFTLFPLLYYYTALHFVSCGLCLLLPFSIGAVRELTAPYAGFSSGRGTWFL